MSAAYCSTRQPGRSERWMVSSQRPVTRYRQRTFIVPAEARGLHANGDRCVDPPTSLTTGDPNRTSTTGGRCSGPGSIGLAICTGSGSDDPRSRDAVDRTHTEDPSLILLLPDNRFRLIRTD